MDLTPVEILVRFAQTLTTDNIRSLRCVNKYFQQIYSDKYVLDTDAVKLYDHQLDGVKFLLDRESVGLRSILNFGTGMGKTATVIYAYKKNPIPTVVIVRKKYESIWKREMIKHGINIPVLTPTSINKPLTQYKRVIMDEIHEPLMKTTTENQEFAEYLKGIVIWGLTATKILIRRGQFHKAHLQSFFGAPDCIQDY